MITNRLAAALKRTIDPFDFYFGLLPSVAGYAAFVSWANLIVRAIRGEPVKEDWRTWTSTVAFLSAISFVVAARVRQAEALRGAAVEMRELVRDGKEEAQRRESAARERDERDSVRQNRLYRLTIWLVVFGALTLLAAIISLVVAFVK